MSFLSVDVGSSRCKAGIFSATGGAGLAAFSAGRIRTFCFFNAN